MGIPLHNLRLAMPASNRITRTKRRALRRVRQRERKRSAPLPQSTFECVEFGAGKPENLVRMAKMHPKRMYVAVDPAYNEIRPQRTVEELRKSDIDPYDNIKRPKNSGILTASATMERFIDNMICQGIRTRNIHLRMPDPQFVADRKLMDLRMLFEEARNILVPNGKILITGNTDQMLSQIINWAKENGLSAGKPVEVTTFLKARMSKNPKKAVVARSVYEQRFISMGRQKVWQIKITYGLKQAFPSKEARRKRLHN